MIDGVPVWKELTPDRERGWRTERRRIRTPTAPA